MSEPRYTASTITDAALEMLYARVTRAEVTIERMKRTNRMVNGGARRDRERAEQAEAAIERLDAERAALLAELGGRDDEARERWIEKQLDETGLKSMDFRTGMAMDIEPARDMVAQWVGAARAMLGDAPNYTETPVEMVVKVGESPERYAFTLQRVGKVTPHQARQRAEGGLATVLRIVTEYVIESNVVGGLDANDLGDRLSSAGFPLPDETEEH
ncbi:hypothetical protein ACIRQP_03545 [Streptomyces sp. NPDC102274]|uniref:hypothetical protein n=1 Tax=Streptomyces sp. NPDC102274 TaxID=3366151 RepID=UPI0038241FF1